MCFTGRPEGLISIDFSYVGEQKFLKKFFYQDYW
jgi:hypothetical protein